MIHYSGSYTDLYELTMAQVYFLNSFEKNRAVFDYFFRKLPFQGGYAVFAGLETLLEAVEDFRFCPDDCAYLLDQGFNARFVDYLKDFRFNGTIYSPMEGDLVFPDRPVLQVQGNIIETQMIETLLLNILNFQTLIATKARRIWSVAAGKKLVDFGLRRAQGPGGYYATRAAMIGGFDASSNVKAGLDFHIPVSGTMAHSFIQSYPDELTAFREYARCYPQNCILLLDTYDTLKSGLPLAIQVAKEMEKRGERLKGIRLDSGDLAWLSKACRKRLDAAGLDYVQIAVSNQLDETIVKSLVEQDAPVDLLGIGTSLVTGAPDAALDGVYKLTEFMGQPRIKLSESLSKITLPHQKQVYRLVDKSGSYLGAEMIALRNENPQNVYRMHHIFEPDKSMIIKSFRKEPLLQKVMEGGKRLYPPKTVQEIRETSLKQFQRLPGEYKRFINPHIYKIGISDSLKEIRDTLIYTAEGER
ncbi:MAG: nicotinate phosphoribosyltransferase [Candidatus Marinimicrobia bacterium]|nr:nicotinate phosphoribosyltransferase [Candidatus Neomarinimicrobiota bacterium]